MSNTTQPLLSQREQEILMLAWGQCLEEKPKLDYNKLATLLGSKSVASAAKTYQNAQKKLTSGAGITATAGGDSDEGSEGSEGKAAGGSKKRAAPAAEQKPRAKKAKVEIATKEAEGENGELVKDEAVEEGEDFL